jgi:glycosyltransferase involved in cell wall biosynthesis
LLGPRITQKIKLIGHADILIGIPSLNNEKTIAHVAKAIKVGLIKYFPKFKAVIVNLDSKSADHTVEKMRQGLATSKKLLESVLMNQEYHPAFRGSVVLPRELICVFPEDGKGNAFKRFFQIAQQLEVKACAVFDSDLRSINPEWIQLMLGPILFKGFDYVTPLYCRHKFDGTITNSIVYPLTTVLYGKDIRQPIGGEFGFSSQVVKSYLAKPAWMNDVDYFGIDIWMTTVVLAEGFRVCQSILGAKIHNPKDPGKSLGPMFTQVVGALFDLMGYYFPRWRRVKKVQPVRTFGFKCRVVPETIEIDITNLVEKFVKGFNENKELLRKVLLPANFAQVEKLTFSMDNRLVFDKDLWAKVVYDFAVFYQTASSSVKQAALLSLVPLYCGYVASYVQQVKEADEAAAEKEVINLKSAFHRQKNYLLNRWLSEVKERKVAL